MPVGDGRHDAKQRDAKRRIAGPIEVRTHAASLPGRHEHGAEEKRHHHERQRRIEHVTPTQRIDGDSADHRSETECQHQTGGVDGHCGTAAVFREQLEHRDHDQRLNDTGGKPLHHAPKDDHVEIRAEGTDEPAGHEQTKDQEEGCAPSENHDEPRTEELAGHHGRNVGGGQELRFVLTDAERAHYVRNRDSHDGAGEDHAERRRHAGDGNHHPVKGRVFAAHWLSGRGRQS